MESPREVVPQIVAAIKELNPYKIILYMTLLAKEWLEYAKIDLETIDAIKDNPRLTASAAFHAQQCIEKSLKAVLLQFTGKTPKIHDLIALLGKTKEFVD